MEPVERLLLKVSWRLPPDWFHYDRFVVMSYCIVQSFLSTRRLKSVNTRLAEPSDIPALHRLVDRRNEYTDRFKKGDKAIIAEQNGQVIGMLWVESGKLHDEIKYDYQFSLSHDFVWTYDGYVLPSWQIKGVWVSIIDTLRCYMRQNFFSDTYCMINGLNRHSINSHLRYGYKVRRQIIFLRFYALQIHLERNLDSTAKSHDWKIKIYRSVR